MYAKTLLERDVPVETPKPLTAKMVLERAALIILERGHCKNSSAGPKGELCVMAALGASYVSLKATGADINRLYGPVFHALKHSIMENCPVVWNYKQNAITVASALNKAANIAN